MTEEANTTPDKAEVPKNNYDRYSDFIKNQSAVKSIFQNTAGPMSNRDIAKVTGKIGKDD